MLSHSQQNASLKVRLFSFTTLFLLLAFVLFVPSAVTHATAAKPAGIINNTQVYPQWGTQIANVDGIPVYSNGADTNNAVSSTYGLEYQCVELVQRYFAKTWKNTPAKWPNVSSAYQMFDYPPSGVQAIKNGSSPGPVRGDAIVFNKASGFPNGHVAIVTDVAGGQIYFAEQNWSTGVGQATWGQDSLPISKSNYISPRGVLPVRGWLHDINNTGLPTRAASLGVWFAIPGISNVGSDNNHPVHTTRTFTVQLYNQSGTLVIQKSGTASYNNTNGVFKGQVSLGNLSSGQYEVQVWVQNTLHKIIPGPHSQYYNVFGKGVTTYLAVGMQSVGIAEGGSLVWGFPLISGDINGDNQIDILDYNILISCMQSPPACTSAQYIASDLDDNGTVDGVDYNLWLIDEQAAGQ